VLSYANTAEPIVMRRLGCGLRWAQLRNHVRDGGADFSVEMDNFEEERAAHCKEYGRSAVSCAKMAQPNPIDLPSGLWTRVGRRKHN